MSTPIYMCALLAGLASVSLCQVVDEAAMERAVSHLAHKFRLLRTEELGVEVLVNESQQYAPTLDDVLGEEDIRSLLTSPDLQTVLTNVTNVLDDVRSIEQSPTNETVSQCCNTSSSPCCYSCPSHDYSGLLVEAETIFPPSVTDSALFQLGLSDGTLLVQPSTAPPADEECVELDSRLQPWYVVATADQPRAVVIIVDITTDPTASVITSAVRNVIKSLSAEDMVSLTLIVEGVQKSVGGLYLANSCSKTGLLQLLDGLETQSFVANRKNLLQEYAKKLNTSSITDRILMIVTDASDTAAYDFSAEAVHNVSQDITSAGISLQVYLANDAVPPDHPLNNLLDAVNASARNLTDISGYYSHLIRPSNLPTSLQTTSTLNSNGELFLSIYGILFDQEAVVGVVNAQLPWKTLLQSLNGSLTGRPQSYFFVVDNKRNIWYHDRASNMTTHNLSPSLLEPEEAFSDILDMAANEEENVTVPVNKTVLLPRTGELEGSYLLQQLPATYNCLKLATVDGAGMFFYTCLLLAEEDTAFTTGREGVNLSDIYSTTPSREPILHSAVASLSDSSCSYFCYQSISDHISLQLTSPIETLASDAEITAYINGSGPLPDGIPSGTAEEVAILSSVSETWVRRAPWQPTSILHRHVATPTGVYMRYPPLSLKETFLPQELVWYRGAVSQVDTLALSPPSEDIVAPEGEVYSASWSLRDSNMQLLAVMAATSTVSSLRVDVDVALNGLCTDSREVDCMVINNEGFFIVNPREFPDQSYFAEVAQYSPIVLSLSEETQSGNGSFLLQKRGCNDLENGSYHQFYWVNTGNDNVMCGTTTFNHYCMQKIPETNAFLVVVEKIADVSLALCSDNCFECPEFNPIAASCFCSCSQEMCVPSVIDSAVFTLCPTSKAVNPNYMLASTAQYRDNDFCWDSAQCCSLDQNSCESSSTCSWCSGIGSCIAIGTCCSGDSSCCLDVPSCFVAYCSTPGTNVCVTPSQPTSPSPSPSMEVSNINTEAAIIGGVVGGIFAILLLALLIVCCVWYQVFRAPVDETHKEKGVFDLTGIRADATNQTAIEITDKPGEPTAVPGENGDTIKQDLSAEKSEGTQL